MGKRALVVVGLVFYDEPLAARVYGHYEADFRAFGYAEHSWREM